MIKYNATYDRWVTDDGKVYRQDNTGAFVLCKQSKCSNGYLTVGVVKPYRKSIKVHRLVWETFKGGIQKGYEIDHEDTHKDNNALSNLILCTHKENCNNPLTLEHSRQSRTLSDFGKKFKENFGITYKENPSLYRTEISWYRRHNKTCRWE